MSRNLMFYFSGTGNSLAIAKMLSERLDEVTMVPILSVKKPIEIPKETESIGIVYPVHMNAIPRIVREFISILNLEKDIFLYAVATHGGIPGKAGCNLLNLLKSNNIELNAYFEIEMINNTPKGVAPKFLMRLDWEEKIGEDMIIGMMDRVNNIIDSIAIEINSKDANSINMLLKKAKGLEYAFMKRLWKINEKSKPKLKFLLDKEVCTSCGICEKVCTTNRISIVEGEPNWETDNCNYCYACFNYCPEQAIGVKHYEKKQGRYHHPDISWQDIANQKLC